MNLAAILQSLRAADPEFSERVSPRRAAIRQLGRVASLAAVPVAFGALLKKAYGKTTLLDETLNYALLLEYLENRFYENAVAQVPFPTPAARDAIITIRNHERAHVELLKEAVRSAGGSAISEPTFDFSGGHGSNAGPFAGVFGNYALFLAVAQTFEDTGVRAYKGIMPELVGTDGLFSSALQIHSVEARHAAQIRYLRRNQAVAPTLVDGEVKPWVTRNLSNITVNAGTPLIQPSYAGEEKTIQATINVQAATTPTPTVDTVSEAFDEMLTMEQVMRIIDPFTV